MSESTRAPARRPWWELLTRDEQLVYERAGYGQDVGWGERPALLVVDVTYAFAGLSSAPILEAIESFPTACGEAAWESIGHIAVLLEAFRRARMPIFYTVGVSQRTAVTRGAWRWKKTRLGDHQDQALANRIPSQIEPAPDDTIIPKTKPSAFFGTPLASYLTGLGVDTVVVVGGVTSGCIRATVVDAFSLNLRTIVVEEAVFDRARVAHLANLLDMHSKYAQIESVADVVARIDRQAAPAPKDAERAVAAAGVAESSGGG